MTLSSLDDKTRTPEPADLAVILELVALKLARQKTR